jgi:hypothetical protein
MTGFLLIGGLVGVIFRPLHAVGAVLVGLLVLLFAEHAL